MANVYDIVIRPIITERSMASVADKKYVFEVAKDAGKIEIKNAVEQIFGVKVAKVNTLNVSGKAKRLGAGRLGTAVSSFISRDTNGYKLIAAFDINPALEGKEISGVTIRPLSELESFCAAHKPVVAVLCVPRQSAMDLSDELVRLGIQGFWNFSHYDLSVVYPQVTVENVHLGDSLMTLSYQLKKDI